MASDGVPDTAGAQIPIERLASERAITMKVPNNSDWAAWGHRSSANSFVVQPQASVGAVVTLDSNNPAAVLHLQLNYTLLDGRYLSEESEPYLAVCLHSEPRPNEHNWSASRRIRPESLQGADHRPYTFFISPGSRDPAGSYHLNLSSHFRWSALEVSVGLYTSLCQYFSEEDMVWRTEGLLPLEETSPRQAVCLTRHLTAFGASLFVPPKPCPLCLSCTTAHVGIMLYGVDSRSSHWHLDGDRAFHRNSLDIFRMATPHSLGSVWKIRVWHDNKGLAQPLPGSAAHHRQGPADGNAAPSSWSMNWLSWRRRPTGALVEKEMLAASDAALLRFRRLLVAELQRSFFDKHIWLSIWDRLASYCSLASRGPPAAFSSSASSWVPTPCGTGLLGDSAYRTGRVSRLSPLSRRHSRCWPGVQRGCLSRLPGHPLSLLDVPEQVTLRNPGSSGRKERPEAGTGSWLGRTRNQVINTLADLRHRGTDFGGSLWLLIITVFREVINLPSPSHKLPFCETKVRAKIHKMKVTTKVNRHDKINGKRKTAKNSKILRKLSMKEREHAEKERQLSEAEENGKLDMKEIHTYKTMPVYKPSCFCPVKHGKCFNVRKLRRRAEDYYKCKIPPSARKPLCNWVSLLVFLAFGHSLPGQDMDTFFSLRSVLKPCRGRWQREGCLQASQSHPCW
ncbi:NPIPA1 isoform 4 [Pan troglodytes]|uniref:NPIPA1 isoform 4 n=1 Tax=Pan troglodytes TaxID=9598 RepID=A0A2J8IJK2_PANTR|nr:NPIPA1 isoform 4 [Pan troglodytes]